MRVLLEGVSKTFADRSGQAVEALSGVSLTAEAEELLAIVAGRVIVNTGDTFPWQIATVFYSEKLAKNRALGVAFMKGYVKASRAYFDAVIAKKTGPAYDDAVTVTARYTGAAPDLIRRGFPYQDRDGRLMPGDVGRQLAWWHRQGLVKARLTETDIVDESSCAKRSGEGPLTAL